jgi:hypothetical protein
MIKMGNQYFTNREQMRSTENLRMILKRVRKGEEIESLLDSHTLYDLQNDFEKYQYEQKLAYYKQELNEHINLCNFYEEDNLKYIEFQIKGNILFNPLSSILSQSRQSLSVLKRKKEALQALVNATEMFIATGKKEIKNQIAFLEFEVWPQSDILYLNSNISVIRVTETTQSFAKKFFFLKKLRRCLGKKSILRFEDLRSKFRSIIKFLFKNMDDEAADQLAVHKKIASIRSHSNYSLTNGNFTNNSTFTRAA